MEWRPPQHLGVVAIEKGSFGLPSTKVANLYMSSNVSPTESDDSTRLAKAWTAIYYRPYEKWSLW